MPIPTSAILRAAARWLEHRRDSSDAQLRALFRAHPSYADITPTQYAAAYEWLQSNGLLGIALPRDECGRAIFEVAIRDALWFSDSDLLVPEPHSMPEDGLSAAEALGIEPEEAFASLRHCWGKVNTAERARLGIAGERALVSLLRTVENLEVRHVAAESDGYGYDIHAAMPNEVLHIEVKSTRRRGRLPIYLSRNEFETMRRDSDWILIAVRLNEALEPVAVATIDRGWLLTTGPQDRPGGRWESVKLDVPEHCLDAGLTPIRKRAAESAHDILRGLPAWPGP